MTKRASALISERARIEPAGAIPTLRAYSRSIPKAIVIGASAGGPEALTTLLQSLQGDSENFCKPAVDVLFRSAAASFGASLLAIVLTGTGQDGLDGSRAIVEAGGNVIVQDQATSVAWGMPGAVAKNGYAPAILSIEVMGLKVASLFRNSVVERAG
jgi:two-component system, chemotaxis family, protein-glutamate methylesterase/glutaminase